MSLVSPFAFYGSQGGDFIIAEGGEVSYDGEYIIRTFKRDRDNGSSLNNFLLNVNYVPSGSNGNMEVLVVGAGGGNSSVGGNPSGGAGAGEVIYHDAYTFPVGSYNITVGTGSNASAGQDSSIGSTYIAGGGGTGGQDGGSGGGSNDASSITGSYISGTAPSGAILSGSNGSNSSYTGGGGGAAESGKSCTPKLADCGGDGIEIDITGTSTYYGGGGGGGLGGSVTGDGSAGGLGGGGRGSTASNPRPSDANGVDGLGGGGGGCYGGDQTRGGDGVVIVKYKYKDTFKDVNALWDADDSSTVSGKVWTAQKYSVDTAPTLNGQQFTTYDSVNGEWDFAGNNFMSGSLPSNWAAGSPTPSFSLNMWIYPGNMGADSDPANAFAWIDCSSGHDMGVYANNGRFNWSLYLATADTGVGGGNSETTYLKQNWYMNTITYDGTTFRGSINGVEKTSFTYSGTGNLRFSGTRTLKVGTLNKSATTFYLNGGKVARISMFPKKLSPNEINLIWNSYKSEYGY